MSFPYPPPLPATEPPPPMPSVPPPLPPLPPTLPENNHTITTASTVYYRPFPQPVRQMDFSVPPPTALDAAAPPSVAFSYALPSQVSYYTCEQYYDSYYGYGESYGHKYTSTILRQPPPPPPPPAEKRKNYENENHKSHSKHARPSFHGETFFNSDPRGRDENFPRVRSFNYIKKSDHHGPSYDSYRLHRSYTRHRSRERSRSSSAEEIVERRHHRNSERIPEVESSDRITERIHERKPETERDRLLRTWRSYYCETPEDISRKLSELNELDENTTEVWVRSSPADLFYKRTNTINEVHATARCEALCRLFDEELVQRAERIRQTQESYKPPARRTRPRVCKHKSEACSSSDHSSDEALKIEQDSCMEELTRKLQHPYRIHPDLWHNDQGEMNDGPLCRCSAKSRRIGIRHGMYPGETGYPKCIPNSNNASKLHHYRITISPPTNFLTKTPTIIKHDEHEFLFEGFSLLSHAPLADLPTCKVIRFNIEYTILYVEEKMPENFTIRELELFSKYLFHELLELVDFSLLPETLSNKDVCPAFHFLPRFVRDLPDNGKEVLSICEVLKYLLDSSASLVDEERISHIDSVDQRDWQDYVDLIKGMLVVKPGYKPCCVRVDQLDRNVSDIPECYDKKTGRKYPAIIHFGIRPPQLSYAGNPEYQKAWREYVKFRHLMANMSKPSFKDKRKLEEKETRLQEMRTQGRMKRNITVAISSKGFRRTGIMCDIVQHAMLIPVLVGHLRFHKSLNLLEQTINYKFKDRYLLQLALTHPSYKENYGTNPDHARNSLTNCGIRQPEYGDRKIHYMNTRKRGINTLINIMSRFGKEYETVSNITHNERLEFLGDAVVEFLSSIHLFFMFPELEEGGLATYRAAIVQNQHLALLAKKFHLEEFMLYAHGSDLCHELELRHAMANCFEALMGSLLLDGGITVADEVFMNALFMEDDLLREIWKNFPEHPLQEQEPFGDRTCISNYPVLQELTKFEHSIGIEFKHIRLLARAFTDRSIGFTHLTLGSNQRLEFLGDTVLQLICSEYLYRHFPEHHEGHLSLLRSSLVNNRTQAVVCDDLGMTKYAVYSNPKAELKTKDRADLLEAFLGALYVDKGLLYCEQFCHVCLFPRLQIFIMNQDWNDPKSKLQQCCLTLRTMDGGEPDIPIYKVIESVGPTNTRVYTVAVYFRSKRLATATGSSIQQAEMNAAQQALINSRDLFPQLDHQKRVIAMSIKKQTGCELQPEYENLLKDQHESKQNRVMEDESHLPKQYRVRIDISSDELSDYECCENTADNLNKLETKSKRISKRSSRRTKTSSSSSDESKSKSCKSKSKKRKIQKRKRDNSSPSLKKTSKCQREEIATRRYCEDISDLSDDFFEENTVAQKNRKISEETKKQKSVEDLKAHSFNVMDLKVKSKKSEKIKEHKSSSLKIIDLIDKSKQSKFVERFQSQSSSPEIVDLRSKSNKAKTFDESKSRDPKLVHLGHVSKKHFQSQSSSPEIVDLRSKSNKAKTFDESKSRDPKLVHLGHVSKKAKIDEELKSRDPKKQDFGIECKNSKYERDLKYQCPNIINLRDLVEDVSSNSDLESGELSG